MEFGTDANAFAQLAYKYYSDPRVVDRAGQPLIAPDPSIFCKHSYPFN